MFEFSLPDLFIHAESAIQDLKTPPIDPEAKTNIETVLGNTRGPLELRDKVFTENRIKRYFCGYLEAQGVSGDR